MITVKFTEEDVKRAVEWSVERFEGTGWEYLVKQFPIIMDDKLPMMDKINLDMHDTFSFANQYYVGFSESRALAQITNYYSEKELELSDSELKTNVYNVLMHEYGHILLEHVFQKPATKELDARTQVVTAEIETNRGIPKPMRATYFDDVIISDEKEDFETVKPFITHTAVYNEVKRLLKNKPLNQPPKDDECSNSGSGGNNDEKEDNSDSGQDGESDTKSSPTSEKNEQDKAQGQEQEEEQSEQKKEQIKRPDNVGTMVQAMRDANDKDNAPQRDLLSELGLQPSEDFGDGNIRERLEILVELEQNDKIKKTLSRIKGSLAGELSKEKVGTYSRPSRKTGEDGLMRRGTKRGATKRPKILIALDESGSMDSTAVKTAATAVQLISKTIGRNRSDITICSFANYINRQAKLQNWHDVVDRYCPDGGTEFSAVTDLAKKLGCDVVLCIGDGEGYLPQETGKLKWLDILITRYDGTERIKQWAYTDKDKETGRRETLWLGNNKRRIEQFAGDM